ncbi:MAG TPA: patatin-like phospholipase family protein, partial [Fodinibius sp.]|nr:patatin-like phospholipase family protein [Fodinibius sp.]
GKEYDIIVGTSTGALMAPLAAMGKIDLLKEAYTNVSNKDIYDINPFKIENGEVTGIKFWNAVWRIIQGKESLGVTKKLRETIERFVPEELYDQLQATDKQVIVAVTNLNKQRAEYKPNYTNSRHDFIDWMWASACVPVYMSVVEKDSHDYVDGGLVDHNPIHLLFERNCVSMDVIMLRPKIKVPEYAKNTNLFDVLAHTIGTMTHEVSNDDIEIAELMAFKYKVDLNFYYLPEELSDNSLVFNEAEMEQWWALGYQTAQQGKKGYQRFYASERE